VPVSHKRNLTPLDHFHRNIYKAVCLHLRLYYRVDVTMVANEVNKFGQIFPIHRRWKYKDITRVISILLISPSKVIYAELFCVKDTPHFFFQTYFRITLYLCSFTSGTVKVTIAVFSLKYILGVWTGRKRKIPGFQMIRKLIRYLQRALLRIQ
jgi:hypothetical protein